MTILCCASKQEALFWLDSILTKDLESGCPKLKIVKFLGVLFFKEDHKILRLQP